MTYAASGATPEFPAAPPLRWSGSEQSLTFFIEVQVLSMSLSNEVNFIRAKSSRQAGTGERQTPNCFGSPCELQNMISVRYTGIINFNEFSLKDQSQ